MVVIVSRAYVGYVLLDLGRVYIVRSGWGIYCRNSGGFVLSGMCVVGYVLLDLSRVCIVSEVLRFSADQRAEKRE